MLGPAKESLSETLKQGASHQTDWYQSMLCFVLSRAIKPHPRMAFEDRNGRTAVPSIARVLRVTPPCCDVSEDMIVGVHET